MIMIMINLSSLHSWKRKLSFLQECFIKCPCVCVYFMKVMGTPRSPMTPPFHIGWALCLCSFFGEKELNRK